MSRMLIRNATLLSCLISCVASCAQDWKIDRNEYGVTSIRGTLSAECAGKSVPVLVKVYCQPAKRGLLGFDLTIQTVKSFPEFHFEEFEGPDAPGGDLFFKLNSAAGSKQFKVCPNGGYGPDNGDQFTFSAADFSDKPKSAPRLVLSGLFSTPAQLIISIHDPKPPHQQIRITFPSFDQAQLKRLLTGLR